MGLKRISMVLMLAALPAGCLQVETPHESSPAMEQNLAKYTSVRLAADLSGFSDDQREMIRLLIEAADLMDEAFWRQAYGDKQQLLSSIDDPDARRFAEINYGPWDRLDDNNPFLEGVGTKPLGATFYPEDMTKDELEAAAAESEERAAGLESLYTVVRRDAEGGLITRPYHDVFADLVQPAAEKLRQAAALAEDAGFRHYLELRAEALLTDDYQPSDLAWMDMKDNSIDVVIGPIENYEDKLYNAKTAYEAYVLIKDRAWSERLARYAAMLPDLQRGMPVPEAYKKEEPGGGADLNAYDVIYYSGDCNAGSKTIAINLPNDEEVQLEKGTRRLQLKNAMRAKFDKILVPIAAELIAEDQRELITFPAFFGNTMFHEVAHGLGIKNTIDGGTSVRKIMEDKATILEEGKADVLGLYMVTQLHERGETTEASLEEHYVTFMTSIFRSIRFGAASSHGKANMIRFNFFREMGAFSRDETTDSYRVDIPKMKAATDALSERLLRLQGDGDYEAATSFVNEMAVVGDELQADLARLSAAGIAVDVVFEQGPEVLGL